jgi:hypothetical protein
MRAFADVLEEELRKDAPAPSAPRTSCDDAFAGAILAGTPRDVPGWAAALDVSYPCSETQIRRAFRRRAFETHPDRGGSHEAFLAVRRAHDEALAALARQPALAPAARASRAYGA